MFESAERGHKISKDDYDAEETRLREALLNAQYELLKDARFPVIILVSGLDGSGKGDTINLLNSWMDPRYIQTNALGAPSEEERERPTMYRFWRVLPPRGRIAIGYSGMGYTMPGVKMLKVAQKKGDTAHPPTVENDLAKTYPIARSLHLYTLGQPEGASKEYLDWILTDLRKIPHVEIIRIGTRVPVTLPFRATNELVAVLKKHHPLWVNMQFNHPKEMTESARAAVKKLADAGIPLGNQSVLLARINDCPRIMKELVHQLVKNRIRPYYLYQCDLSEGELAREDRPANAP